MTMTTVFGIKNCDSVKKARKWLDQKGQPYSFHDFRTDGLDAETIAQWLSQCAIETLVNKRSTTWKQLSDAEKSQALSDTAAALLVAKPTLIKRPVLARDKGLYIGFSEAQYSDIFS